MNRTIILAGALMLASQAASAHIVLERGEAAVNASYKAVFRVTHGCNGSPTVKLRMTIPEGVIAVKPMPKAGWKIEVVRGPYAKAYPHYHGTLSEGAKEVVFSGGSLDDQHYDEFTVAGFLSPDLGAGNTLLFPVVQECETGSYSWTAARGENGDPAPTLRLLAQASPPASAQPAPAKAVKAGSIEIKNAWSRATPTGAKVGAGYLEITNRGTEEDRLISLSTPASGKAEIHEMTMRGGVMHMRALPKGLAIPPGQTVALAPGGLHLMFVDLGAPLKQGQKLNATLVFERAGKIEVEFSVQPVGARAPAGGGGAGGHHHH